MDLAQTPNKADSLGQSRQRIVQVLKYCTQHWRKQPARVCVIIVGVLLAAVSDVLVPFFAGRFLDALVSSKSIDQGTTAAALALGMLAFFSALALTIRYLILLGVMNLTLQMMKDSSLEGFRRVQRFATDWHTSNFTGSTVRKVTRGSWAVDVLNDAVFTGLLPTVALVISSVIFICTVSWQIGAVILFGSIGYFVATYVLTLHFVAPASSRANKGDSVVGGVLADAITCNSVVKAFAGEHREEDYLQHALENWETRQRFAWTWIARSMTIQEAMQVFVSTLTLLVALLLWFYGVLEIGDAAFVLALSLTLQAYIGEVGQHLRNLQRSSNELEELVDLQLQLPDVEDAKGTGCISIVGGRIDFQNVSFGYNSSASVLFDNLQVSISSGERVGLVGRSGSGKSTFVKLIQRLYEPSGGQILVDGQDISIVNPDALRRQIGLVPQDPILFHRSIADNIAYGCPAATPQDVETAAQMANAHDFISLLPQAYETIVGERGMKLSGGERQRIAIARAFLQNAPLLILDEATSSLDPESELLVQQAAELLMKGRTTLVIAHRLSTVLGLDRLLVFDRGDIVEDGTHETLISREGGIYSELYRAQSKGFLP